MKKSIYHKKIICLIMICIFILGACSNEHNAKEAQTIFKNENIEKLESETEKISLETITDFIPQSITSKQKLESEIVEIDWSEYFDGLNGAAVVYDTSNMQYTIFNKDLALTQRSPCSTFKIISSLIALENNIIEPNNSTQTWSGEVFWNEKWNHDMEFHEAFQESCVWYFREVIDEIGQEIIQKELDKLQYGNCNISDWEGRLNTNNNNRALTGFWIESSLIISPKEQTEVMARIFGETSVYSEKTRETLRQVMLVAEQDEPPVKIYGKTGMGKTGGVTVDAWFTGFAEKPSEEKTVYFCVYLGRTDNQNVTSAAAKEIAVRLVSDYLVPES